jgi:hypothetical protein
MSVFSWRCVNQRCAHLFLTTQDGGVIPDFDPTCPKCHGSAMETQRKAPSCLSAKTRGSDQALKGLANRYDLSDMGQRGGTRIGETALQVQNRALQTGDAICSSTKSALAHKISVPAGGPRFQGGSKALPTTVVAAHKG